ncbi:hypothetical protein [Streptomyces sp. GC420]|uniref:hypothetical protein n=1 Tax=Streptomyces sp. GC420 TaxID=2697568 RepID=UPI001414EB0E|nr:hypothetical protein [Streptomyces sp. GC420]NBM15297.1 hypothetical protein [Streptomyces sp. GC420]
MLALRLIPGSHPLVLLPRLLVAAASAGTGFLLLCALAYALSHPGSPGESLLRLAWCAVPLAATVNLAVAVARTGPGTRARSGLLAAGLGPVGIAMLTATTTALSCALGSTTALLVALHLRGDITGLPFDGAGAGILAGGRPLPLPATLTLLALVPAVASAATAHALRPRDTGPARASGPAADAPAAVPAGLPWGAALTAAGLAFETYATRNGTAGAGLEALRGGSAWVPAGWALAALGLAVAGPGLTHACGRLLSAVRPGPVRLLAGRALQQEARRIGRPLGVLCAVTTVALAASDLHSTASAAPPGPPTALGVALVLGCTAATLLTAAAETRLARTATTDALLRIGTPAAVLRGAAALRAAVLLMLFGPLTWAVAHLTALPMTR